MKNFKLILISMLAVCVFTACVKEVVIPPLPIVIDDPIEDSVTLKNVKWKLTKFAYVESEDFIIPTPDDDGCYWVKFYENGTLNGWTASNEFWSKYAITTDSAIQISNFGITFVMETPHGILFSNFFRDNDIERFSISGNELRLYHNDGRKCLLFERREG